MKRCDYRYRTADGRALAEEIAQLAGEDYFHFFDAAAPIVTADSLDYSKVYRASRYDKGDADYLNCPFETKEEYVAFWEALRTAELAPVKDFEKEVFFEACMPIEEMARRGEDTMRFGPLKPVGLVDKRTGKELMPLYSCGRMTLRLRFIIS